MNSWYLNRFKTLSLPEYPYRARQLVKKKIEEVYFRKKRFCPAGYSVEKRILKDNPVPAGLYQPSIKIFGKEFDFSNADNINWHEDIFSNKSFPEIFAKKISILKDPSLSAKAVWEVNRLQFLMKVALNYKNTGDAEQLTLFIHLNKSWIEHNPYLTGVNWYSNIEVNLRLINWFLCWEAIDADSLMEENKLFKEFVVNDWIPSIYAHCIYSYQNPSKYSSANNHLISEYAGLFIASSKWKFPESEKWNQYSKQGLEKEIKKQHSDEGINKEEAAEYIQFITDFFLLSLIVGENTRHPFSNEYKQQLYKIFEYIYHFIDCRGSFPKYGDEDDGKCFIIDFDESFNNFKSLLTSAAILFQDSRMKFKSNGLDRKNLFLFGNAGKEIFNSIPDALYKEESKFYKEEGHFIFRKKEGDKEVYLHFDAAPLGFLSIAAHGHADALSFILHLDGQPFFIDSGTFTYHTEEVWRDYFIGTLAHNTIRINKMNQANSGGPTLWLNHYRTTVLKAEINGDYEKVKAMHDGYETSGIIHSREISWNKKTNIIKIYDHLDCKKKGPYFIELPFHLHPLIRVKPLNKHLFQLTDPQGRVVSLATDLKLNKRILHGQVEPEVTGWYSESFMYKEPCSTLLCSLEATGNIELVTEISIN